jgi:hypothetical protein
MLYLALRDSSVHIFGSRFYHKPMRNHVTLPIVLIFYVFVANPRDEYKKQAKTQGCSKYLVV